MVRLLILGASGRCGGWLTSLAVARGHETTVVVRPGSSYLPPKGVHIEPGSITDSSFLGPLLEAADVAVSCVGLRRRSVLPWSRLLSPPDLVTQFARVMAGEPAAARLHRFVWISAGGVGDSRAQTSRSVQLLIGTGHVGTAYRDLEEAERVLFDSSIAALAVRPVTLTNGSPTGRADPVRRYGLLSTIRRSDVATWMLNVADGTSTFDGDRVLLGTAR